MNIQPTLDPTTFKLNSIGERNHCLLSQCSWDSLDGASQMGSTLRKACLLQTLPSRRRTLSVHGIANLSPVSSWIILRWQVRCHDAWLGYDPQEHRHIDYSTLVDSLCCIGCDLEALSSPHSQQNLCLQRNDKHGHEKHPSPVTRLG